MAGMTGLSDEARIEQHETLALLTRLDELENEGDLKEWELEMGLLLQFVTQDHREVETPGSIQSEVWLRMARLACAYYQKSSSAADWECAFQLVDEFMKEAIRLAEGNVFKGPPLLWCHGDLLRMMDFKTDGVEKYEDMLRSSVSSISFDLPQIFVPTRCWLRVAENFSTGRVNNVESLRTSFARIQGALCELNQPQRALLWSERSRIRDMTPLSTDHKGAFEFDTMDDERAWAEVQNISKDTGGDTVIFILSNIIIRPSLEGMAIHMLYNGELVKYASSAAENACTPKKLLKRIKENNAEGDLRIYYDIVVRPFETELQSIQPKKLIFIPSRELSLVPFGAIIDEDYTFLIERYALTTISSLRLLKHCNVRQQALGHKQKEQHHKSQSLVVGNPTMDLYSTKQEAAMVASILQNATENAVVNLLQEGDATKDSILRLLPSSDWIHIASHCDVNYVPDRALILAMPEEYRNEPINLAAARHDLLTGNDIVESAGKCLLQASVVVLSTGAGIALPRSFHVSGVPSVVTSLWDVRDGSTRVLMEKFYMKLLRGMDIASSLQSAVVEMIHADDNYWQLYDMMDWAFFIVSGTPFTTLLKN